MRQHSIYKRVVLTNGVVRKMQAEGSRYCFQETGGPLVGYVDSKHNVVVVDAGGPGPRARHRFRSVTIDGKAATEFCDRWRERSSGSFDYIGDWHTHVGRSVLPSEDDRKALVDMQDFTSFPSSPPISIILSRRTWGRGAYVLAGDALTPLPIEIISDAVLHRVLRI